jgi:hypothetical protein
VQTTFGYNSYSFVSPKRHTTSAEPLQVWPEAVFFESRRVLEGVHLITFSAAIFPDTEPPEMAPQDHETGYDPHAELVTSFSTNRMSYAGWGFPGIVLRPLSDQDITAD